MKKRKVLLTSLILSLLLCMMVSIVYQSKRLNAAEYGISSPRINNLTVTWDYVSFGNYWQNDTNGDGLVDQNDEKEPIKWRVLSVDGNDIFLLAEQNLDCKPYNTSQDYVTWETCTLRTWLNETFLNDAFTEDEQNAIQTTAVTNEDNTDYDTEGGNNTEDKIYLLSLSEVKNTAYGFTSDTGITQSRCAKNTAYAEAQGAFTYIWYPDKKLYAGNGPWWLRSPGYYSYSASDISIDGSVNTAGGEVEYTRGAVRPALHLNLSSDQWEALPPESISVSTPEPMPTTTETSAPTFATPSSAPTANVIITKNIKPTATPVAAPTKPTIKSAKNNKKKTVTLTWKKVKNAKGYEIQYATNKTFSKKSKLTKSTKVVIKKLKKKKTYSFRVRAYALDGKTRVNSKWSKVKRVKIKK